MFDLSKSEGDWVARQFFSQSDLDSSPEEYAAWHSHLIGCFALHFHKYKDPMLGAWVRRLGEILGSAEETERCRERFLGPDDLARVRREATEEF